MTTTATPRYLGLDTTRTAHCWECPKCHAQGNTDVHWDDHIKGRRRPKPGWCDCQKESREQAR